jgi:hypothetical protein
MPNQDSQAGFHGVHHNTHHTRERGDPEFPPPQTPPNCSTLTILDARVHRDETVSGYAQRNRNPHAAAALSEQPAPLSAARAVIAPEH